MLFSRFVFTCTAFILGVSLSVDAQKCFNKATKGSGSDWPFMAYLVQVNPTPRPVYVCGAILISKKALVTSAHCFDDKPNDPRSFVVKFGSLGADLDVERIEKHPLYSSKYAYNDIAVVHLLDEAPEAAIPICLPKPWDKHDQRLGYVLEWLPAYGAPTAPRSLTSNRALIATNDVCNQFYVKGSSSKLWRGVATDQMCTDTRQSQLSCNSFTGSPMILPDQHFNWMLVGLSSMREQCENQDFPGVYTRITKFVGFLRRAAHLF